MKPKIAVLLASCFAAGVAFAQPALVCPPSTSTPAGGCDAFHYHVQLFRPEPRGFVDATATPRFASQAVCEKVREAHVARNAAVVQYFRKTKNEQQYEADRFGPCHCDLTGEKTNAAFLNEAQRNAQMRAVEDVRLRVREKLLDSGLTTGDELVRNLLVPLPSLPLLGSPKVVNLPQAPVTSAVTNSPDDLRSTTALDSAKPAVASLDLPLADVTEATAPPAPAAPAVDVAEGESAGPAVGPQISADANAADMDAAAAFIEQETERIQNLLAAASEVTDEAVKNRIFEATLQRTQVLSNLRTLIEGSGVRSRLALAARDADSEEDRLALVSSLFGDAIAPHWAPKQPADVILPPDGDSDSEPERVLRDRGGRYNEQQKKRALYMLLSRSQPSAEQQLWLITVVDSFLQ
ncbi:MAG TPA: hypothetical protein VFM36_04145 [Thermoanaerobaculia bacterium]|nr:hypothetical protein [Thermoanaerobaculia bacterium]